MQIFEIWKDIKGYEGIYQCSSFGRVKSLDRYITYSNGITHFVKGVILKQSKDTDGYKKVNLSVNQKCSCKKIHQLVFECFVNSRVGCIINHIDGIKTNNAFWNLEIVTNRENIAHYSKGNTQKQYTGVESRGKRYRAKTQVNGKTRHIGTFDTAEQASDAYANFVFNLDGSNKYCR